MADKSRLRSELREQRRRLPAYRQKLASISLMRRALAMIPGMRRARNIAFFIAADGETNLMPLANWSLARNISCYLPVLDPSGENCLWFARYTPEGKMVRNRFGIAEPQAPARHQRSYADMDIIFMPTVGFDKQGRRLGMGGGFYDRTLAGTMNTQSKKPLLVAVAHDFQQVENLPEEPWDIHPDITLTPSRIIRR